MITIKYDPTLNIAKIYFPFDDESRLLVKGLGADPVYEETKNNEPTAADLWKIGFPADKAKIKKKFLYWKLELNRETEVALNGVKEDKRFSIDPLVFHAIETTQAWREENYKLSHVLRSETPINDRVDSIVQYEHRAAADYLFRNAKGVILADDIELDRKASIIATLELGGFYPVLILIPSFIVGAIWLNMLAYLCPDKKVKVIEGYKWEDDNESASVYIVKYTLLEKYKNILSLINWNCAIFDVSVNLENPKNLSFRMAKEITKDIPHKFLISDNDPAERPHITAYQLELLGLISEFGGFWKFINTYTRSFNTDGRGYVFGGAINTDRLDRELREIGYIARVKESV